MPDLMQTETTRILLIEDNPVDALFLRRILANSPDHNFDVEHVTTAKQAISRLQEGSFDLVLSDLGIPDAEGFDHVLQFRTMFPGIPVVILSGVDDESIGMQAVECGAQDFLAKELVPGQLLCRSIRYAIARQSQITSFKTEAHTDALTGLPNRRAFESEMKRRLAERKRFDTPLSLMMLDIDHFKTFNDTYGHRAGDYVLCKFGAVLSECMREIDFPARYGGEEFSIVLPATQLSDAQIAAQRLLPIVAQTAFHFAGESMNVTASAGLAEAMSDDDLESLVARADRALYEAKRGGRNRAYTQDGTGCEDVADSAVGCQVTPEMT